MTSGSSPPTTVARTMWARSAGVADAVVYHERSTVMLTKIKRHSLVAFFALAYGLTCALWIPAAPSSRDWAREVS